MKKLVLVLVVLLVAQSYGIYGAMQARRIMYTCTMEVGPLCYAWEDNAIGKVLGPEAAERVEDELRRARDAWEEEVVERIAKAKKGGGDLNEALEKAADFAGESIEAVKEAARKAVE